MTFASPHSKATAVVAMRPPSSQRAMRSPVRLLAFVVVAVFVILAIRGAQAASRGEFTDGGNHRRWRGR
jgi:hypothetical protein